MDDEVVAGALDALYGVPREDFVEERDRRVRELKDAGQRDEAEALSGARKPTVPAWAVDRLARDRPDEVEELIAAGQALRDAQRRAASGRGADELRTSTRRLRDLVTDLRRAAERTIDASGGSSSSHLDDVERTLFTAAVTPEHHDTLRRGVFAKPLEGSGFGGVEGLLLAPAPAETATGTGEEDATDAEPDDQAARAEEQRRREAERRRRAERHRLERHRADLERSREDQRARVERAEEKAAQLRARTEAAEAAAAEEREELDRIADEQAAVDEELRALGD